MYSTFIVRIALLATLLITSVEAAALGTLGLEKKFTDQAKRQPASQRFNLSLQQEVETSQLRPAPLPATTTRLLFVGDIMLDRNVKKAIQKNGFDYLFKQIAEPPQSFFIGYDLVSANLEGAVTSRGDHYPPVIENDFAFDPSVVRRLRDYNINFLNVANNHLTDQGSRGVKETYELLDGMGFTYAGCADAQVGECTATTTPVKGQTLGMVGLSMVYHDFDLAAATSTIASLASSTDLVVVNIHWGMEYQHQFSQHQQDIAHAIIDAGADLIIGTHSHVIQGMEIYKNKPIFYSLGNFIFDQFFSDDTQQGLAVAVYRKEQAGKLTTRLLVMPLKYKGVQIQMMTDTDARKLFKDFIGWSSLTDAQAAQISVGELTLEN